MSRATPILTGGWVGYPTSSDLIQQDIIDALSAYGAATACGDGTWEFTYTLTSTATGLPLPGVAVRFSSDLAGLNTLWTGRTDALGVARNLCGDKPRFYPITVYVWRSLVGYSFSDPDTENVGP